MAFLIVIAAISLFITSSRSILAGARLLRSEDTERTLRRRLWRLLALGILGGGYLAVGLIYASAKTRWYGAPMPVVVFQPMDGKWVDFVSPFSVIAPIYNFVLWLGLAFAPVTLPGWWRKSSRGWRAAWVAAPAREKAVVLGVPVVFLVVPPLIGYLLTTRHVVVVKNQSGISIPGLQLSDGQTSRYRGSIAPGEERVLDFEQSMQDPYIFSRKEGKSYVELGRCEHTNGRLNRYVVTISGDQGDHVECVVQSP